MTEARERELMAKMGQLAQGYDYDIALAAFANLMLNALRQKHPTFGDAQNQLGKVVTGMVHALKTAHYRPDGSRNDRGLIIPTPVELAKLGKG